MGRSSPIWVCRCKRRPRLLLSPAFNAGRGEMKIAVPNESGGGERRVALVPDVIKRLTGKGHEVVLEAGAGQGARIPDALFEEAGATIGGLEGADVVVRVTVPSSEDISALPNGSVLVGFLAPLTSPETARAL